MQATFHSWATCEVSLKKVYVPLSVLKQKARQKKREGSLTHQQALDAAAESFGFTNYKNYRSAAEKNRKKRISDRVSFERAMDQERDQKVRERIGSACLHIEALKVRLKDAFPNLSDNRLTQENFEANSDLKVLIEQFLLTDFLEDKEGDTASENPYHVPKEAQVRELKFELNVDQLDVRGDIEVILDFAFDHDKSDTQETYQDIHMSVHFCVSVSSDLEIEIDDLSTSMPL